jgi:hypothetical protein
MSNELHDCASTGNLERVKELVEGGASINEVDEYGTPTLSLACKYGALEIVEFLVKNGANVAHTDRGGTTALHFACACGNLSPVKFLLEHGARITERDDKGTTPLLYAAKFGRFKIVQFLLSSEVGASITETDTYGNTALLLAAKCPCHPTMVQWLLEYGGAQITDIDKEEKSVWDGNYKNALAHSLRFAHKVYHHRPDHEYRECVPTEQGAAELLAMLRVMVLHGGPPESLTNDLSLEFQQVVQDGARLRTRLPAYMAYLAQRRVLLDAHLLTPLAAIVHSYEKPPTTTDELWATGLGALSLERMNELLGTVLGTVILPCLMSDT